MLKQYKNILIIRFSSLGDVLLTTPVLDTLKTFYPESRISFITKEQYAPLFKNNNSIDELILLEDGKNMGLIKLLRKIRERKFDLIIDLHKNLRSFIISSFLKYSEYYSVNKRTLERRTLVWLKKNYIPEGYHVVKAYLETLKTIVNVDGILKPKIHLGDDEIMQAQEYIKNRIPGSDMVAFAPGARWKTKQWEEEYYATLGDVIQRCSKSTVLLVGDNDDRGISERICSFMKKQPVNLTGLLSIRETASFLKLSKVVITNDSGLMHVAVATGTPVISIFGPTVPDFGFYPLGEKDVVLQTQLDCRPCALHGGNYCPEGHHNCMKNITVEMVWEKVLEHIT